MRTLFPDSTQFLQQRALPLPSPLLCYSSLNQNPQLVLRPRDKTTLRPEFVASLWRPIFLPDIAAENQPGSLHPRRQGFLQGPSRSGQIYSQRPLTRRKRSS
jgi:hypothetical protein